MATVKTPVTGEQLARRASFKDRFYFREWRGKIVVASKPGPRKRPLSERQQTAVDKFKQAAVLAKLAAPSQQIVADELSAGTQFFARDLIYMAMYGTLAHIQMPDGRKLFSVAALTNVSDLLDAIAQLEGQMMFRGTDTWEPIPAGEEEFVLTWREGKPLWLPASGGGGGGYFQGMTYFSSSVGLITNSGAGFSQVVQPRQNVEITRITAFVAPTTTPTSYHAAIGRLDAYDAVHEVIEVVGQSESQPVEGTGRHMLEFAFPEPVPLLSLEPYALAVFRDDGNDKSQSRPSSMASPDDRMSYNGPLNSIRRYAMYEATEMTVGLQTWIANSERNLFLWPEGLVLPED